MSRIGEKRVLHKVAFPENMREDDKPDRFISITIIETREVRCDWGDGYGTGLKALGSDGRIYLSMWDHFDDASSTPYWSWLLDEPYDPKKVEEYEWYDVCMVNAYIRIRPIWLDDFKDIIRYCPIHQRLDYDKCFYCHRMPEVLPPKDYSWNGWK